MSRIQLKKRILVQNQAGREVQLRGILMYFEELNRTPNAEFGTKDFFEMDSSRISQYRPVTRQIYRLPAR